MRLILVLGDQLTDTVAALREGDPAEDVVVMAEVADEASYVPHHPKKIAFCFAAMRHFAEELRAAGWTVEYTRLDEGAGYSSIVEALIAASETHGTTDVIA
ncbi:MAG: cryptochrome/photolyase family protein, partial [Pseudomonadota bacterium]